MIKKGIIKRIGIALLLGVLVFTPVAQASAFEAEAVSDSVDESGVSEAPADAESADAEIVNEAEAPEAPADAEPAEADIVDETEAPEAPADAEPAESADVEDSDDAADDTDESDDFAPAPVAVKANAEATVSAGISISSIEQKEDGDKIAISVSVSGLSSGSKYKATVYASFDSSANSTYKTVTSDTGSATLEFTRSIKSGKTHDVYVVLTDADGTSLAESAHTTIHAIKPVINKSDITVSPTYTDEAVGTITVAGDHDVLAWYRSGVGTVSTTDDNTITGLAAGEYYIYVPAHVSGDTYYIASSKQRVTVTETDAPVIPEYVITTTAGDHISWSKSEISLKEGVTTSVYVRPTDADSYRITGVTASPEENVSITFSASTGEVFISEIKGNVRLTAQVEEIAKTVKLKVVDITYNKDGNYSEQEPAIQTTIRVKALDKDGNPVSGTKLYFKADAKDPSATQIRTSDDKGVATFIYSYAINTEGGNDSALYNAAFSFDKDFAESAAASATVKLAVQKKQDLVLYTDQLIGTRPGENDGKVINVPDHYELWSGEVHQGALVVGSGEWIRPVNGEFTGLSAGQHLIRAGEYTGEDGTLYLASNYADFFIPRGVWNITVDTKASEHVVFTGETAQTAEPGGTVYIYLKPANGYTISEYSVDKPKYVSGGIRYSKENGYVVIEGISGNVVLTVKTTKQASGGSSSSVIPAPGPGNDPAGNPGPGNDPAGQTNPGPATVIPSAAPQNPEVPVPLTGDTPLPVEIRTASANTLRGQQNDTPAVLPASRSTDNSTVDVTGKPAEETAKDDDKVNISDGQTALAGAIPVADDESIQSEGGVVFLLPIFLAAVLIVAGYIYYKNKKSKQV